MILSFVILIRLAISQSSYICVCLLNKCNKVCQKSNIEQTLEIVQPNNFEQYIIDKHYSSHHLLKNFKVYVTFNDQPIQFNLSSFNNLQISFQSYFDFAEVSNKQSNILIRFENDDEDSSAQLSFFHSDVIITNSKSLNLKKSTLSLNYLKIANKSTLSFEKKFQLTVLKSKCCSLNDFSYLSFDEIYVDNGFCKDDFILAAKSIQKLRFNQSIYDEKYNYLLEVNDKVKIFGALKLKITSTDNSNLLISSPYDQKRVKSVLSPADHINVVINGFRQVSFERDSYFGAIFFKIYDSESVICKVPYLIANFQNTNLYVEKVCTINGTFSNLSIFSTQDYSSRHFSLSLSTVYGSINIQSSFIDVDIDQYYIYYENPITFCVGKGGISKVRIKSIQIIPPLTIKAIFSKVILNRDFQKYLSDAEIEPLLYKNHIYLQLPTAKSYLKDQDYENNTILEFSDNSKMIHGFSNFDSILTPIEISESPQIFAIYFESPNKKLLKLCLTSNGQSKDKDCFAISPQNMNTFTKDLFLNNVGVENVLIDIQESFKNDVLNFDSFVVKNLTITANSTLDVVFGTFNFVGKVTSNLTFTNIHNFTLNIEKNQKSGNSNIDNITIINCDLKNITSASKEKVHIENFSIDQNFENFQNFEINNFNYLVNCAEENYILASYDSESLFFSTSEFFNLSGCKHFNFFFPFMAGQNVKESSPLQKNLYVFVNTNQVPKYNIIIADNNVSIFFYTWEDFPDIFDDLYKQFEKPSHYSIKDDKDLNTYSNITVYNSGFDINAFFSFRTNQINFIGDGFVAHSLNFRKKRTISIEHYQNDRLDSELEKSANEEVIINLCQHNFIGGPKPRVRLSSVHNKVVHFNNLNTKAQKFYIYEKISQNQDPDKYPHKIYFAGFELRLKSYSNDQLMNGFPPDYPDTEKDDDDDDDEHHFSKVYFDDVTLLEGSSFKGFDCDEITFRKLDCPLTEVYSFEGKVNIRDQLVSCGTIRNDTFTKKKTIHFQSGSLLNLTLKDKELKISIGERLIEIGNFVFVGLSHAYLYIDADDGYSISIEPIKDSKNGCDFKLFPKVSLFQKLPNKSGAEILETKEEEIETYKEFLIKTKDSQTIKKIIKEKKASSDVNFSNNGYRRIQKVKAIESTFPSSQKNSIHLIGEWSGCGTQFAFYNLKDVDFHTDSKSVPFHFESTVGSLNLYVNELKTNFLGDFHFTNAKKTSTVGLISPNQGEKMKTNVTFCGSFGGLMNVSFYFYQEDVHANFEKVTFRRPNTISFHLYMTVDGYSSFTIYEGSSSVSTITYLNFNCTLELTDQKVTNFLNEKEKVLGYFVDNSYSNRVILGWDVFPSTHGLYESYQIYYSRPTRKLLYLQQSSPYEVPLSVCISDFDICEVNIDSEKYLDDIRPLIPKGKNSILLFLTDEYESPVNFDYSFFDNFTIYCIGMGIIEVKLKLGYNHVSNLDISEASVKIVDNNYSIDYVRIDGYSKIINPIGIKRLHFTDYQPFKLSNIEYFPGRISIPSNHDQIVFQKDGMSLKNAGSPNSFLFFNSSKYPDFEIRFEYDRLAKQKDFLIDDEVKNDTILPIISVNFTSKVSVAIGKGWEKIAQKSVLNDVYGLSNVDQIKTESFPFQPLTKLLKQEEESSSFIPVYPSENLFPISVPSEATFSANETMIINLSTLLNEQDAKPGSKFKPSIHFNTTVVMNDNSQIQVLDKNNQIATSQGLDDCYIEIKKLVVSKNSSVAVSSTRIDDELEVKESSNLYGNLNFMPNSTLIINGKVNIQAFELLKFPSIIFDSYPTTTPSRIIIKLTNDNDDSGDKNSSDNLRITKRNYMSSYSSIENNPGVVVSNLGFICANWEEIIQITGTQHFFFVPICVKGFLKVVRIMNSDPETDTYTENPALPTMTPYKINMSEYVRPTMTPVNREKEVYRGLSKGYIGVIIVASFFVVFFVVLIVVVFNLKKKYNKLLDVQDEDDNDDGHPENIIKL